MKYFIKLCILFVLVILSMIGFAVGKVVVPEYTAKKEISEVDKYAHNVDDIVVPDDAIIVGIGEATHGNVEFQIVKLDVLKQMIENGKCASIAFEMPIADGSLLNNCVHDINIMASDAIKKMNYTLYCTDEMTEMVSWIQSYNSNTSDKEDINIYGIDMQASGLSALYTGKYIASNNFDIQLTDDEKQRISDLNNDNFEGIIETDKELFEKIYDYLENVYEKSGDREVWEALYNAKSVNETFIDHAYYEDDADAYSDFRDECMLENLEFVLSSEQERGYEQIVLTGHNGHLMKGDSLSYGSITLGQRIFDKYGADYFVIGTDFYNANVNIRNSNGELGDRYNHKFCSTDPLAAQASRMDEGMYYLKFDEVSEEDTQLYNLLHDKTYTGMVGEAYSILVYFFVNYRYDIIQSDCYDAMIYVYEANPINPILEDI